MPGKELFKIQGSSKKLTGTGKNRISAKNHEDFSKQVINAELETLIYELSEIDRSFQRRNFIFERLEKRKPIALILKYTGFRLLFSLLVKINNIINKERDEAFHRQNQILKDLIGILRKS